MDLFIPVLLGTGRDGRQSEKAAHFVVSVLEEKEGVSTELVDVRSFGYQVSVPPWDPNGTERKETSWQKTMSRADGLIIVVPEYNRGYPGELKLALDSLYDEYDKKPVGLCGVSSGSFGGARVVEHIKPVLLELGMVPVKPAVHFRTIESFDGTTPDQQLVDGLDQLVVSLTWYARTFAVARGASETS